MSQTRYMHSVPEVARIGGNPTKGKKKGDLLIMAQHHRYGGGCYVGSQWFPVCHMCLKTITDSRDVPVRDDDALIAVVIRMAGFPGSRLASRPPRNSRLCRPCYDHLKRIKDTQLVSRHLLQKVGAIVSPWWTTPGQRGGAQSPPLCPGFVDTDVDPNIRRRLIRSLNPDCVARVDKTISDFVARNNELHKRLASEAAAEKQAKENAAKARPEPIHTARRDTSPPLPPLSPRSAAYASPRTTWDDDRSHKPATVKAEDEAAAVLLGQLATYHTAVNAAYHHHHHRS